MDEEEEEAKERQENELEVLQSIFLDDVQDLRLKDAWKLWRPLELEILLKPQQSMSEHMEVHAQISLCVKCSHKYPNRGPQLELKNAKGMSKTLVEELKKQLIAFAQQLKGEVMILELCQHVQRFLHTHNKPQFQSFYEEMLCNKKRQEEEIAKEEQRKLDAQRKQQQLQEQAIQDEIRRKQEALKEEARKRRSQSKRVSENEEDRVLARSVSPPAASTPKKDAPLNNCRRCSGSCEPDLPRFLSFHTPNEEKTVQLLRCLGHNCRGSSVYLGVDLTFCGDLFAVTEWTIRFSTQQGRRKGASDDPSIIKQVNSLEQEFTSLSKIKHKNLVHYLAITHEKTKDRVVVQVMQECVIGTTLGSFLNQNIPLDVSLLRHYTKTIVEVLDFLHNNSIIHRDLRASSIFIESSGLIRLSDYSLEKKLSDLGNAASPQANGYPLTFGKGGKKGDVYRLGIILLSLSVGNLITDLVPKIPSHLNPSLKDFLQKCLQPNEHERWTCDQLLKHSFTQDQIQIMAMPEKADSENERNKAMDAEPEPLFLPLLGSQLAGRSRLQTEFEVLQWLGKGGFGDVLKVRNKLDGRLYAIKKISLNPSRQQLNRKIMREVKLLSRLNHENVVRYYNSWIETTTELCKQGDESSSALSLPQSSCPTIKSIEDIKMDSSSSNIEKMAPPKMEGSVEWSVSYEISSHPHPVGEEDSSDDEEEDIDIIFGTSFLSHSLKDSVIFDHSNEPVSTAEEDSKPTQPTTSDESEAIQRSSQFMYIQMEFCERSTLRIVIDNGLCKESERMWRLFREIIEGLGHIHQQGMIHRDLKPVNIFLDVNDHVKIGDFGLATTDIIPKAHLVTEGAGDTPPEDNTEVSSQFDLHGDGSLTGAVGTALYLAPELMGPASSKIHYSQKVDLYSLGIIFFEMCYPTPSTGMERVKLLINLRQKDIVLPPGAQENLSPQQLHLINWLLHHDPLKRPTCDELLSSDSLPPPLLEEAELNEMLRHTVSNPQSKGYKRMMASLFRQRLAPVADFSYDIDVHRASVQQLLAFRAATCSLERIMHKHGALQLLVPTLTPKANYGHSLGEGGSVHLMDHGGALVTLPINLRVSFARFIARREISQIKRYAIEKVYREKKVYGCHPRELYECAFDIVTPTSESLLPDAEVLAVVSEVISEFPKLQNRNYYVRMNHYGLLRSILMHCGISEEKHRDIYQLLVEHKLKGMSKFHMQTQLSNMNVCEQSIGMLLQLTEPEDSVLKLPSLLRGLTKTKGHASLLARQSLGELQAIITYAENLGLKVPVIACPGFVYEPNIYSGMIFQFICEQSNKGRKGRLEVLAAGGRYNQLISSFRLSPISASGLGASNVVNQSASAVGVSISIEKITTAIIEEEGCLGVLDVVVCSVGKNAMVKEKCTILRTLWGAGVHTHAIYEPSESVEEATDFCKDNGINYLLILKDSEPGSVKIRSLDKERFTERKIALSEVGENIPKFLNSKCEQGDGSQTGRLEQSRSSSSILDNREHEPKMGSSSVSGSAASFSITSMPLEKLTGSAKKRTEAQIQAQLGSLLPTLSSRVCVEVLAMDLSLPIVKTIASELELESEGTTYQSSLATITEKYPRHRKYIIRLAEHIYDLRFEKKCPVIVLYSIVDNNYKVML